MKDIDDYLFEIKGKDQEIEFVDPDYPLIKKGVKFTPNKRESEYSVYIILDTHPIKNQILVGEIVYSWCSGYYMRLNKTPVETKIDRDILLKTHSPAHQGKALIVLQD